MEVLENAFEGIAKEHSNEHCKKFRKQLASSVIDYQRQKEYENINFWIMF